MNSVTNDPINDGPNPVPAARRGRARKDPLGPDSEIGSRLRALYAAVEQEPIPMQLIELLERLSDAERKAGK